MDVSPYQITYFDLQARLALVATQGIPDGFVCEITDFIDDLGDSTDDPAEATVFVVKVHPKCWLTACVDDFDFLEEVLH